MSTEHRIARWVEDIGVPLLMAFVAGLLAGQWGQERRTAEALATLQEARLTVAQVHASLDQWRYACEPLLSVPVHSTPELIPGPEDLADGAVAVGPGGTVLRVVPATGWGVR